MSERVLRVLVVALCGVAGFVGVSLQRPENLWGLAGAVVGVAFGVALNVSERHLRRVPGRTILQPLVGLLVRLLAGGLVFADIANLFIAFRETQGHCVRVSKLTYHLGKQLGLSTEQLKSLERGALLHDIGKIGISDDILLKPGPLVEVEWQSMRQHPDLGARMIEGIPFLQDAIPVIRYHQERLDGSGYPQGLKGKEIPLQARVFAVADVFDALTSTRPYRQRVTINEAVRHIRKQAGVAFDPRIVDALEKLAHEGEIDQYLAQWQTATAIPCRPPIRDP